MPLQISESLEFLDQTKRLFQDMENLDVLIPLENVHSSEKSECYDLNGLFASLISGNSNNKNVTPMSVNNGRKSFSQRDAANLDNQLPDTVMEGHILVSDNPTTQFEQSFLHSTTSVKNNSSDKAPCMGTWSCECSMLTTIDPPLASELRVQDSSDAVLSRANSLESCRNEGHNIQGNSTFSSLYSAGELADMEKHVHGNSGNLLDNHQSMPSNFATGGETMQQGNSLRRFPKELSEEFKPTDFATDLFNFYMADDLSQWFASAPDESINVMAKALSDDFSQLIESTSASCSLVGSDTLTDIPIKHPANSVHSSITNTFNAEGHEKSAIVQSIEKDIFDGLRPDIGCSQVGKCWEDIIMPISSGGYSSTSSALSKCFSELDAGSKAGSRKGLFSELGLEDLLIGTSTSCSVTNSNLEDQSSPTKRRRIENASLNGNQAQLARVSSMSLLNYSLDNHVTKKEVIPKSQVGLWIDDSYSITTGSAVLSQPQKPEEHTKATRKRARPGESTRPRPKDRQQIQDRIKELRGIIPNGGKVLSFSLCFKTSKNDREF